VTDLGTSVLLIMVGTGLVVINRRRGKHIA
jgi:hypothetical protein